METKTDKKGHFAFGGLGTGAWRVTASKEGYVSAATEIQVSQIKANPPVILTLTRASAGGATALRRGGRAASSTAGTPCSRKAGTTRPSRPSRNSP